MFRQMLVVLVAATGIVASVAHADTRGTLRLGLQPLELEPSSDTPLFGQQVDRAVDKYNTAAAAHDRASGDTTARIEAADLGVVETLLVVTPGLELGADGHYFFRIEAPIGFADNLTSVGIGVYPLNLQVAVRRSFVLYASAGGAASWLDRPGAGDVGGLVVARAAAGLRIARHLVTEVGYSAFALGGSVNNERLANMTPAQAMDLAQTEEVLSAGEARGMVDVSIGIAF